jgi:hypothetical protein
MFLTMWDVSHWWGFTVGEVGREVSIIIIINLAAQILFCILRIKFSLILYNNNILGNSNILFYIIIFIRL